MKLFSLLALAGADYSQYWAIQRLLRMRVIPPHPHRGRGTAAVKRVARRRHNIRARSSKRG